MSHTIEDSIEEMRALTESSNKRWYRLYMDRSGQPKIVHVSYYDELDMDRDRFLSEEAYVLWDDAVKAWGYACGSPTCPRCGRALVCPCGKG